MYDYENTSSTYNETITYGGHSGNPQKTQVTYYTPSTASYRAEQRAAANDHWGYNGGSCIA